MKTLKKAILAAALVFTGSIANASIVYDFVEITESGPYGESAWSALVLTEDGVTLTVTAEAETFGSPSTFAPAFAYLDWSHAGLGVCRSAGTNQRSVDTQYPGSSRNLCNPGSDDNVTGDMTFAELLNFAFDTDVIIERIWFNNTHDEPATFGTADLININGVAVAVLGNGYATGSVYNTRSDSSVDNFLGPYIYTAGGAPLTIGYNNEQFYVSAIQVASVPEPSSMALIALGLAGFGAQLRRKRRLG